MMQLKEFPTYLVLISLIFIKTTFAADFIPSNILRLDTHFLHHVLIVEKSTHSLYLYRSNNGVPELVKKYKVATGQMMGNKKSQGDKKTPEGIYQFQDFHSKDFLLKQYGDAGIIYGAGAFTTNYPNIIDRRQGKTGGGIWLHSTDDDTRVDKGLDSKGCVVAKDSDLKDISQFIDLKNTSVIVVQDLNYLIQPTWEKNKLEIESVINTWSESWKIKDFENYIQSYSKNFVDNTRGNLNQFRTYKKAVFSRADTPIIDFKNMSILVFKQYAVVTLEQHYSSPVIQDVGKKTLYLEKDADYKWKIVAELWSKIPVQNNIAFTPSMRFFKNELKGNEN